MRPCLVPVYLCLKHIAWCVNQRLTTSSEIWTFLKSCKCFLVLAKMWGKLYFFEWCFKVLTFYQATCKFTVCAAIALQRIRLNPYWQKGWAWWISWWNTWSNSLKVAGSQLHQFIFSLFTYDSLKVKLNTVQSFLQFSILYFPEIWYSVCVYILMFSGFSQRSFSQPNS